MGLEGNHLVPLPPPVRPVVVATNATATGGARMTPPEDNIAAAASISSASNGNDPKFGRIAHSFVDPTGYHTLLSAQNREAYYPHLTLKKVGKLNGFGPGADGSYSGYQTGLSLGDDVSLVPEGSPGDVTATVQIGIIPGSYVTTVGWD